MEDNMQKWYQLFPKNTGLSLYVWIIFCVLPFYFIFKSSATVEIAIGILVTCLFFIIYRLSFISEVNKLVYLWVTIEMAISIFMTLFFGYVYFSLFLSFFIGNIKNKIGFFILYGIHLLSTIVTIYIGFFIKTDIFLTQLPFIMLSVIGIIVLPLSIYNRNKHEKLEFLLDDANKKLSKLIVIEERQRIARDLHDTLGQKLSLIGLKSDLAGKLMNVNPEDAKNEIQDIHQTARVALKEVREMVSDMRGIRLDDEVTRIGQILRAAQIECVIEREPILKDIPLLVENVLSMCLKEAVTNVVKHSQAKKCLIRIQQTPNEMFICIKDNGLGLRPNNENYEGHGITGMKERLDFMNGSLDIFSDNGTTLNIRIPSVIQGSEQEELI